jgi:catechol 2,3-dioxygenase-like lactoylglutathione lyase family enzyme
MKLTALIPMLSVSDLKRSIAFYRDGLGFHVLNIFGEPDPKWCMIGRDGLPVTELRVTGYGMKEFELRDPDNYWLRAGIRRSADGSRVTS